MSSDYLILILEDLIDKLYKSNIFIKAIICDQNSTNCRLFKLLGITSENPSFKRNDEEIFGIFDPPHLLKTLRRNLMKYNIQSSKGLISYDYIEKFYLVDKKNERQCAPKLTERHIFAEGLNSMKVRMFALLL